MEHFLLKIEHMKREMEKRKCKNQCVVNFHDDVVLKMIGGHVLVSYTKVKPQHL